jgi:hypothetical protein
MFVPEADGTLAAMDCFHGSRDPVRWQERA